MLGHGASSHVVTGRAAGTAEPQSSISHGTVLLTSKPVTSSETTIPGKVVSFAPEPAQEQQQNAMPSIPGVTDSAGSAKENIQDQASQQAPPPQPGRKFKRDRSSRKNSFSLPPVPPKKQASAAVEFSPATSLEFALHGAASAPLTSEVQGFPAELAAANMRHSASAQDMITDTSSGDLPAAAAASEVLCGDKSSRSSSADVIFCADGIDFNSRAWKMMSRKEKNRASAAASRARREAYTESLEHKVPFYLSIPSFLCLTSAQYIITMQVGLLCKCMHVPYVQPALIAKPEACMHLVKTCPQQLPKLNCLTRHKQDFT